jgi:putative flippase GtrA
MKSGNLVKLNELWPYVIIGGIATVVDWSVFTVGTLYLGLHYQMALVVAYFTAGITHYIANKMITFKCESKKVGSQVSLYLAVATMSLLLSMGVLGLLISAFGMNKIAARIVTTLIMLMPNYLFHKHITFNKKIFA